MFTFYRADLKLYETGQQRMFLSEIGVSSAPIMNFNLDFWFWTMFVTCIYTCYLHHAYKWIRWNFATYDLPFGTSVYYDE